MDISKKAEELATIISIKWQEEALQSWETAWEELLQTTPKDVHTMMLTLKESFKTLYCIGYVDGKTDQFITINKDKP